jgi:hypothetical protein
MITQQNDPTSQPPTVNPLVALNARVAELCGGVLTDNGIQVGEDTITISTRPQAGYKRAYSVMHLECACPNMAGREFSIDSGGMLEAIAEKLNIGDMNTGFVEFDSAFHLQSSDDNFLRRVLESEPIRAALFDVRPVAISCRNSEGQPNTARITVAVGEPTEDAARLAKFASVVLLIAQEARKVSAPTC